MVLDTLDSISILILGGILKEKRIQTSHSIKIGGGVLYWKSKIDTHSLLYLVQDMRLSGGILLI